MQPELSLKFIFLSIFHFASKKIPQVAIKSFVMIYKQYFLKNCFVSVTQVHLSIMSPKVRYMNVGPGLCEPGLSIILILVSSTQQAFSIG
jgi:hypothetical protein